MASFQLRKSAVEATEMAKKWYQRCKFENFNSKDRSPCIEKVGRVRGMARRESNSNEEEEELAERLASVWNNWVIL